jgi:predicted nucleic acid-binding protein
MLVEGKARGLLAEVRPILDALAEHGFWLSLPLRRTVLDAVQE